MITKFIEAQSNLNWGKFMVGRFDSNEWRRQSVIDLSTPLPLISRVGWTHLHLLVFDLATGEGGLFRPGNMPSKDLARHRIWVCPMFEPFMEWLYKQDLSNIEALPDMITIPQEVADKHEALAGYRRPGPDTL